MLKIHDLYGQSFAHEFQFTNPDSIRNAVKRYNSQRAAERDETKKDRDAQKLNKLRFCKMRNHGHDVLGMVTCRDLDVETQMSLDLSESSAATSSRSQSLSRSSKSRSELPYYPVYLQRLAGGADTANIKKQKYRQRQLQQHQDVSDAYASHIEGLHRDVCAELESIQPKANQVNYKLKPKPKAKLRRQPAKQKPQLEKMVQRRKPDTEQDKIIQRLKQVLHGAQQQAQPQQQQQKSQPKSPQKSQLQQQKKVSYEDYPQPQAQWADVIPSPVMPHAMDVNDHELDDVTSSAVRLYMQQHGSPGDMEPEQTEPLFADDSDLEQEYVDRPGYMRYIQRQPYNYSEPETGEEHKPCFVELEPHPNWISLQRSTKPMLYTSQRSDTDTNTICDTQEDSQLDKGAALPKLVCPQTQQQAPGKRSRSKTAAPVTPPAATSKSKKQLTARQLKTKTMPRVKGKTMPRQPGGRDKQTLDMIATPMLATLPAATQSPLQINSNQSPRRRKGRTVVCTRSLENLKYEKMAIYNRISLTQERIITSLDRLQSRLLKLQMPTCSNQEKQRRERNAFKFCVKFSRNFLFPLRGLIEDVRCTPVANFNSASSNEASQRVVCVYSLMHHSIASYRRQLRYFLLDKVPQKLSALIEMMYTLTNVCLEKGILDRQDPVVECLQQRCTSFLTFIEDMQEERFQLARETYRRLQKRVYGHGAQRGAPSMHERYDLKMFLNDLKLYEPRLVPKERKMTAEKRRQRCWIRRLRNDASPSSTQPQSTNLEQPFEMQLDHSYQDVPTHIECVQCGDYRGEPSSDDLYEQTSQNQKNQLSNILSLLKEPVREKHELHQQLLEAMEHVTKSQVREVLDPLVRSLGAMLDKKA